MTDYCGAAAEITREDLQASFTENRDHIAGYLGRCITAVSDRAGINNWYTLACFGSAPLTGSLITLLYNGGALVCVLQMLVQRRPIACDRRVWAVAIALWIYCAAHLISALVNGNIGESATKFPALAAFAAFPLIHAAWSIADREKLARFALWSCALACYAALPLALVQFGIFGVRAEGGAGNAIIFAVVTTFSASLALVAALRTRHDASALFYGAFLCGVVSLVVSGTRGIWPVMLLNTLLVVWFHRESLVRLSRDRAVRIMTGVFLIMIALCLPYLLLRLHVLFNAFGRMLTESFYDTTAGNRYAMWMIGLDLFWQRPLLGYGAGAVRELAMGGMETVYQINGWFAHFHNVYINTMIRSGLFGLLPLLFVLWVGLRSATAAISARRDEAGAIGGFVLLLLVSTFAISGMTNITLGHDIMDSWFLIALNVGFVLTERPGAEKLRLREITSSTRWPSPGGEFAPPVTARVRS